MIGAIKRRWKSKKAKVLHKGNELSSSSDSCPTSRGFVDGPEDFEKMIKPPSPRQVHPVLEKGDLKFHNLHHLIQQNNGNGSPHHPYILQQPPSGRKKSSTLPSSDEGTSVGANSSGDKDKTGTKDGCHFIRVNSGRIELVSKESPWKGNSSTVADQSSYNTAAERFINRHLKNDVRHSWCGSAIRSQQKTCDASQPPHSPHQSKRHSEDNNQQHLNIIAGGFRGALGSNNNNNRIYPQEELTSALAHPPVTPHHPPPSYSENTGDGSGGSGAHPSSNEIQDDTINTNAGVGGTGLLSPLRERLAAIEELTTSLQSWQSTEKTEYEKCVSDLANQVSRAVALQQLMKGEVEKLQQRVVDLENHNKAMATMIIPTLMKLHDTTMGSIKDAPTLKSIEPAPPSLEEEDHQMSASTRTMTISDCDSLQTSLVQSQHELSPSSSLSRSYIISRAEASASPSNSQNASSKTKTICYEEDDQGNPSRKTFTTGTRGDSIKREKQPPPQQPSPSLMSSSTPATTTSVRSSPVKAPRMSKMTSGIPKMNGSSNGNISGSCVSSSSSLGRSNSCNTRNSNNTKQSHNNQPISLMEDDSPDHVPETSLELSISSNSEIVGNIQVAPTVTTSRTAIPRMSSSPARSSRIPQQGGTPKPARRNVPSTTIAVSTNDSRSCSPQRGSRLPVRKATLVPVSRSHPAATSRSLPSHNNMSTPFQNMTRSGPEASKHSKSTFGFGSPKKSSAIPNRSGNVAGSHAGSGNKSDRPSTSSSSTKETEILPESVPATTTKSIRLAANSTSATAATVVPKVSGSGKDEGYSTMSSEALAEQEHHLLNCLHHRNQQNAVEKSTTRVTSLIGAFSNNSNTTSVFTRAKVASLPKTNKIAGIGSPTATMVPSAVDPILEAGGGKRSSIHKSNTFNTFREMDREARMRNKSQRSYRVCDDDEELDDECDGGEILPPGNNYRSGGSTARQFTSLPNSSSSASSSPSKGSKPSSSSPAKRSSKSRVTTTRMKDGNIVRIVRGSPYSIQFGEESADDMEDEEDPSSSTILWEDSDDSDILFLPLEVSEAPSPTSSRSTLVPPPMSSGESRSYYSSWSRGTATTATCSTMERGNVAEGSNTSLNNDSIAIGGGTTFTRRAYPLARTKGEVTVDILLGNQACGGDSGSNSTKAITNNKIISRSRRGSQYGGGNNPGGGGDIVINETDQVDNSALHDIHLLNNPIHDNQDDLEEKALIEKWMQLEEVRNEQVHGDGGEQWAWDWDGVERTYTRVLRNGRIRMRQLPVELDEDDDDIIDVDLILEGTGLPDPDVDIDEETERVVEERNALNETAMQIDSNTWTKSKSSQGGRKSSQRSHDNKEAPKTSKMDETPPVSNSQEASPEKMRREEGDSSAILTLEGECEHDGPLIKSAEKPDGVNEPSRFSDENPALPSPTSMEGKEKLRGLSTTKANSKAINLNENGVVVTSCGEDGDGDDTNLEESGGADGDAEDDPPPVIEFTPEFYRLANYGSNLSFSDNDSTNPNSVNQSPKAIGKVAGGALINNNNKSGPSSPARSPKKRKHLQRRTHTVTNPDAAPVLPPPLPQPTSSTSAPPILGKMDDKISQTDFSSSSLENMSSVSSELSAEYRNCLDIIKKLVVAHGDTDEEGAASSTSEDFRPMLEGHSEDGNNSGAFILENRGMRKMDGGSYATTWISVPKGLPTGEVDRILEILSSSESEGVLSPK